MTAPHERIPVTLLTGFLGSGKTTLVNALLRHPELADTAVIVNEFGAIGLDHLLITAADDNVVLLGSGCLCCAAQGGLRETLADLFVRRVNGDVPRFRRVMIETSGLADPGPIINQLAFDSLTRSEFQLAQVVTVVDARNGLDQLDHYPEATQQAALADVLLLSKSDLASSNELAALATRLSALNPTAPQLPTAHGAIAPERILHTTATARSGPRWLDSTATMGGSDQGNDATLTGNGEPNGYLASIRRARHTQGVHTLAVTVDHPVSWAGLAAWMAIASEAFGRDLLRVKGIVAIDGQTGPVVVHAVAGQFHAPEKLTSWPSDDHRSRLVVITRNVIEDRARLSLSALALPSGAARPARLDDLAPPTREPSHAT